MASGPYNFVAAILDAHLPPGGDWRAHAGECLARRGLRLEGESVHAGSDFVARARLCDPAEASAAFGGQPWFSLDDRGEFRGRPVGFFNWEHYGASEEPFDRMAVFDFRGTIGRVDTGEAREAVVETRYRLDNLLSKFGFADGDALLHLPGPAYEDAVSTRIEEAMAAAGWPASIGVAIERSVTIHNPVTLIGGMVRRGAGGEEVRASQELLAGIEVDLVTYNLRLLSADDKDFWRWP